MFDKYPEYCLVGEKWVEIPKGPEVGDEKFVAPSMAWLPDEAYRASDPKAVNPRDIYPVGVCPPEPAPAPRYSVTSPITFQYLYKFLMRI